MFVAVTPSPPRLPLILFAVIATLIVGSNTASASERLDANALSAHPDVVISDNGDCSITGAMWAFGPEAFGHLELVEKGGSRMFPVTTDAHGIYRVTIPNGKGAVFVERNSTRLRNTGTHIPYQWQNATAVCSEPTVIVGDLIPVQVKS